jgi:hypothetical protein
MFVLRNKHLEIKPFFKHFAKMRVLTVCVLSALCWEQARGFLHPSTRPCPSLVPRVAVCGGAWDPEVARTLLGTRTGRRRWSTMLFPGGQDGMAGKQDPAGGDQQGGATPLVGFWSLLTNKMALEQSGDSIAGAGIVGGGGFAGEDTVILRADGQVAGGPRVPGWEDSGVAWASEQRAAGGSWREYTDSTGKRRLEVALLLPPASAAARAKVVSERPALFYDGLLLEMCDYDMKTNAPSETPTIRVVGTVSTGAFGADAAQVSRLSEFLQM